MKRSVGGIEAMRRLQSDTKQGKAELVAHDPRVLGDSDTVASLLAVEKERRHAAILSPQRRAVALQRMLENVSRCSGLTMVELCGQSRRHVVVLWRRVAAYLAVTHLGASAAEARRLLGLSTTPVLVAVAKGPGLVEKLGLNVRDLLE